MNIKFEYNDDEFIADVIIEGSRLNSVSFISHEIYCSPIINDFLREYIEITDIKEDVLEPIMSVLDGTFRDEIVGVDFTKSYITPTGANQNVVY